MDELERIADRLREISFEEISNGSGGYPDDIEVHHGQIFIATVEDRYGCDNKPVLEVLTKEEALERIEDYLA